MYRFILLLTFLFFSIFIENAYSDTFGSFSFGLNNSNNFRMFNLGYREQLFASLKHQYEFGFFLGTDALGSRNSLYVSYQIGAELNFSSVVVRGMVGPAALTKTDTMFNGMSPQLNTDLFFGFKNQSYNIFGLKYKHVSSGESYYRDVGYDFIGMEISIPW